MVLDLAINDVKVNPEDYPKQFPPKSTAFEGLVRNIKKEGLLIPVFVDGDHVILTGHYRF